MQLFILLQKYHIHEKVCSLQTTFLTFKLFTFLTSLKEQTKKNKIKKTETMYLFNSTDIFVALSLLSIML